MDAYLFFREIDEAGLDALYAAVDDGLLRFAMPTVGDVAAIAALEAGSLGEVQDVIGRLRAQGLVHSGSTVAADPIIPIPVIPRPMRKDKNAVVALCAARVRPDAMEAFIEAVNDDERLGSVAPVVGGRSQFLLEVTANDVADVYSSQEGLRAIDGVRVSMALGTLDNARGAAAPTAD